MKPRAYELIAFVILTLLTSSCGRTMVKGTVVDAVTQRPIDGAVLCIEWYKRVGPPGLDSHKTIEIAEYITKQDGKFEIPKLYFRDYIMAIYKKGYLLWSSMYYFPSFNIKEDISLEDGMIFKMDTFEPGYSRNDHNALITLSITGMGCELLKRSVRSEFE